MLSSQRRMPSTMARASARGLVAAMAMTGLRNVTANAGLVEQAPPEAVAEKHAPRRMQRLRPTGRQALVELVHWTYGASGGAVFGALPRRFRQHAWSGPLYGTAVWLAFELGLAPVLGIEHVHQRKILGRAMIAADHVLYGIVVAGWLAPQAPSERRGREPANRRGNECVDAREGRRGFWLPT